MMDTSALVRHPSRCLRSGQVCLVGQGQGKRVWDAGYSLSPPPPRSIKPSRPRVLSTCLLEYSRRRTRRGHTVVSRDCLRNRRWHHQT